MAQVGFGSRGVHREKECVSRHRGMSAAAADSLCRYWEGRDRRAGQAECEAGLAEYEEDQGL